MPSFHPAATKLRMRLEAYLPHETPQGDTKYHQIPPNGPGMTPPRRYMAGTTQRHQQQSANNNSHVPAQPTGHGIACMCVCAILCKQNTDQRPPTTTTNNQPSRATADPIPAPLPAPSSFIVLVRHWGLLPTTLRPYQACAKPAPRSADVLAHSGADGRLSAALIGCGGRLMRLGGCRLQHRPPTDYSLSGSDVCCLSCRCLTHAHDDQVCTMHVPAKQGIVTNYVSHVQIHRKSTANPSRQVRGCPLGFSVSQFRCFSSSLPPTSCLRPCLIPSYHLIYRCALVYIAETIMVTLPCSLPFTCPRYPTPLQSRWPPAAANCR